MMGESFEQRQENLIFEYSDDSGNDEHFLHRKHSKNQTPKQTKSFDQALDSSSRDKILYLHQCSPITPELMRSVAMNCGSNIISICFSSIFISDKMLETILPHLTRIEHLQFDGVTNVGSVATRAIAMFCHETLKSLRVSGCQLFTSESCGWLGGIIGHNSSRLRHLKALDVSSTKVDNRGFAFLSKGLPQLESLDMAHCTTLTSRVIKESLRDSDGAFSSMVMLNLRGCKHICDEGVVAIAQAMANLKHLDLSNCGNITNKSTLALGASCIQLITLSLEGAKSINDAGLGIISNYTKLELLNITGCRISRKSLLTVINTLGYVQESNNFYGFVLRGSDVKVSTLNKVEALNENNEKNNAVRIIQEGWKAKRHSIHEIQSAHQCQEQRAAIRIQSFVLNRKSRQRFLDVGHIKTTRTSAHIMQKLIRGWLARQKMKRLISRFRSVLHSAAIIQSRYRGTFVRTHNIHMPAILAFRALRLEFKISNAATVLQCAWRNRRSIRKLACLRAIHATRRNSSTLIQRISRGMLARRRRRKSRLFAELYYLYYKKMATKIQCSIRQYLARRELDWLASERFSTQHLSSKIIQSYYRGSKARQIVKRRRIVWNNAAIEIQRMVRGRSIKSWQVLKREAETKFIHEQAASERDRARTRTRSDLQPPEGTDVTSHNETETVDESPLAGTPGDDELLKYVFGHSFVDIRCLIYWPDIGIYKTGTIGSYDDYIRLWRVDYNDDDSAWLDLVREQDKVMVIEGGTDNETSDWIPFNYCRPLPLVQYLQVRREIEPSGSTWSPPDRREKISNDLCYYTYLSRGLLDECYTTRSFESLERLRSAHLVKFLTVSIAKMKYMNCATGSEVLHVESLLNEIQEFLELSLG